MRRGRESEDEERSEEGGPPPPKKRTITTITGGPGAMGIPFPRGAELTPEPGRAPTIAPSTSAQPSGDASTMDVVEVVFEGRGLLPSTDEEDEEGGSTGSSSSASSSDSTPHQQPPTGQQPQPPSN